MSETTTAAAAAPEPANRPVRRKGGFSTIGIDDPNIGTTKAKCPKQKAKAAALAAANKDKPAAAGK